MPKLNIDWDAGNGMKPFLEVGAGDLFDSHLPSADSFAAANIDELFGVSQIEYAAQSFDNFADLSLRSIYNVAKTSGIETYQLEGLATYATDLIDLVRMPAGMTGKEMIEQVVIGALDLAFGALGMIPIFGWIVKGAYDVGKTIYMAVREIKKGYDEMPVHALAYSADRDQDLVRRALDLTSGTDWTRIFMPAVVPESFESKKITWGSDRDGVPIEGYMVRPKDFDDVDGLGCLPGLPKVYSNFQMPRYYKQSKHPLPGERPIGWAQDVPFCSATFYPGNDAVTQDFCKNIGEFQPSLTQLGYSLWSMVRTNGANAFRIDQNKIMLAWNDYFDALEDYVAYHAVRGDKNNIQRAYQAATSASVGACAPGGYDCWAWSNPGFATDMPGFMDYITDDGNHTRGTFFKNYHAEKSHPDFKDQWAISYFALIRFLLRNQLAASYSFLNTITVAYVNESFPAIGGQGAGPGMKDRWFENRKLLLTDVAVLDVEADLIPDDEYKSALLAAQNQAKKQGSFDLTTPPIPGNLGRLSYIPVPPVYPHPPPLVIPKGGKGKGAALLMAAGVAMLLLKGRK